MRRLRARNRPRTVLLRATCMQPSAACSWRKGKLGPEGFEPTSKTLANQQLQEAGAVKRAGRQTDTTPAVRAERTTDTDLATLLRTLMGLPLSDEEKADAVRRLLREDSSRADAKE